MAQPIKVMVVEDEAPIRRLVRAALDRSGYRVIEAADARAALAALAIEKPEAVLLDLGLPDRDGLELIQTVRQSGAVALVVSARVDTTEKVAALDLGADDYLTKPFDTEELLARIRTALRHRLAATAEREQVRAGALHIDLAHRRVTRAGDMVHLTPKEYGVLALLAAQPDRVVPHARILREVWGPAHERQLDYLRIVVRALRLKVEPDPAAPTLILNEPGVGYRLRADAA